MTTRPPLSTTMLLQKSPVPLVIQTLEQAGLLAHRCSRGWVLTSLMRPRVWNAHLFLSFHISHMCISDSQCGCNMEAWSQILPSTCSMRWGLSIIEMTQPDGFKHIHQLISFQIFFCFAEVCHHWFISCNIYGFCIQGLCWNCHQGTESFSTNDWLFFQHVHSHANERLCLSRLLCMFGRKEMGQSWQQFQSFVHRWETTVQHRLPPTYPTVYVFDQLFFPFPLSSVSSLSHHFINITANYSRKAETVIQHC